MIATKKKYNLPKGKSLVQTTISTKDFLKHPINYITKNMEEFDGTYSVSIGLTNHIILTQDPGFISYVLKENQRNYQKSGFAVERAVKFLGNGLVFSDGDYWRRQRRLIQPGFHRQKIQNLAANVLNTIQTNLPQFPIGKEVDIYPIINKLTFKILIKSLFDIPIAPKMMELFDRGFGDLQDFLISDINNPLRRLLYPFNGKERKAVAQVHEIRTLILNIIKERKSNEGEFSDILDMLLNSRYEDTGEAMANEPMIDELLIFLSAGQETTANTLAWILYLLAAHPEIQEKLYQTVANKPIESVANNLYLQGIIQEGMRLYTTTWSTQRVAINDDSFGEYVYPKGTVIVPFFFGLHRDKNLWDNALQFQPERFMEGEKLAKYKHFFPFGAGPRMCIGNHFALMEMAYFLVEFVKTYKIKTTKQLPEMEALITMRPDKVVLNMEKRED